MADPHFSAATEHALEAAYLTIIRLTQGDNNDVVNDKARGVCSFLETESRAKIFKETLVALQNLRRIPDDAQSVGMREALIEQCAKIAEPWSGFMTGDKMGAMDSAIVEVREEIAAAIRSLAPQPSPADTVEELRAFCRPLLGDVGSANDRAFERLIAKLFPPAATVETKPEPGSIKAVLRNIAQNAVQPAFREALHDSRNPNHERTGGLRDQAPERCSAATGDALARMTEAVRDEVGSRLCHWQDGAKRVCTRDSVASFCLCERTAEALMNVLPQPVKVTDEVLRLRAAMDYACDLLAERTYGSSARSPGHNARLHLETALALSRPHGGGK